MFSRTLGFSMVKDKLHRPCFAAPSCVLPNDVLINIFLRLPPDPACLLRASFACKHWHSLIVNHQFLHHFQLLQKTPMLGIFTNSTRIPRFLPVTDPTDCAAAAAAFSLPDYQWHVLGCRNSHVLLAGTQWKQFIMLNPINGNQYMLKTPPDLRDNYNYGSTPECNAAVLCAAGHADRGYCHSCPFFIVCVFTSLRYAYVTRYSSESRSWTKLASARMPSDVDYRPSVLVQQVLYWPLKSKYILAFELSTRRLYHIECPPETHSVYRRNVHIMQAENGGLGLASMTKFNLHLWARETGAEDVTGWVLDKVIELDKFLPLGVSNNNQSGGRPPVRILGLVEDDDLVFVWTENGVFAIQLKSMQFKKVFEANEVAASVYPFKALCIAGMVTEIKKRYLEFQLEDDLFPEEGSDVRVGAKYCRKRRKEASTMTSSSA